MGLLNIYLKNVQQRTANPVHYFRCNSAQVRQP